MFILAKYYTMISLRWRTELFNNFLPFSALPLKNFHTSNSQLVVNSQRFSSCSIPVLFLCVYHKRNPQASSPNIGSQALPAALICNNGFYDCILSKILSLLIPRASKLFPITFYIFAFSTLNVYTDNLTFLPAFTALIPAADNVINVLASSWTGWSWFVGLFWLLLLFSHTAERFRFENGNFREGLCSSCTGDESDVDGATWCQVGCLGCCFQCQAAGHFYIMTDDGRHCAVKEDWRGCAGGRRSFNTQRTFVLRSRGVKPSPSPVICVFLVCVCQCSEMVTASTCCGQCV